MPIFQLRRGVLLTGHHPWGRKTQGWIMKAFGLIFKWRHPESTVWFESSISLFGHVMWRKKFMPVVPESETGDITQWTSEKKEALREDLQRQAVALKESGGAPNENAPYFKWRANGAPIFSDKVGCFYKADSGKTFRSTERYGNALKKRVEGKEPSCSSSKPQ